VGRDVINAALDKAKEQEIKPVESLILEGDPAEEIINYAKYNYIDMIVMGSEGLGSVASKVCRGSDKICVIVRKELLEGKRILIVDDEPDVVETLEESLSMCQTAKASTFEEARALLEKEHFDMAILDIMGVDGFKLLEIADQKKILAVMLTAHALSPENTFKSFSKGAASYVPKEKMAYITTYLNDVLEAKEKGRHFWGRWFERFGDYYNKKFGSEWKDKKKEMSS
jgi:CheY-like chemotaxis protein